jgi:hypothetical protein
MGSGVRRLNTSRPRDRFSGRMAGGWRRIDFARSRHSQPCAQANQPFGAPGISRALRTNHRTMCPARLMGSSLRAYRRRFVAGVNCRARHLVGGQVRHRRAATRHGLMRVTFLRVVGSAGLCGETVGCRRPGKDANEPGMRPVPSRSHPEPPLQAGRARALDIERNPIGY